MADPKEKDPSIDEESGDEQSGAELAVQAEVPAEAQESASPISKFKLISDPIIARTMIMDAVQSHAEAILSGLPEQQTQFKARFTADANGKKDFWIQVGNETYVQYKAILEVLQLPLTIKFKIFIRHQPIICFESKMTEIKEDRIHFDAPEKMYYVQRRKHPRFRVPAAYELWVEFKDPHYERRRIKKRLLDLGMGGVAILVGPGEAKFYRMGVNLGQTSMVLQGEKLSFTMEVRNVSLELTRCGDMTGLSVGCMFKEISPMTLGKIEEYLDHAFAKTQSRSNLLE